MKHAKTPLTAGDRGEPMGLIMGEPRRGIEIRSKHMRYTCETGVRQVSLTRGQGLMVLAFHTAKSYLIRTSTL